MELIWAKRTGEEVAVLPWDADIECGGSNTFEVSIPVSSWDGEIAPGSLIYVPWTEYGGIVGEIETTNDPPAVLVKGYTWRGLLSKKIIQPKKGQDYYTISGNSTKCITTLLNEFYKDMLFQAGGDNPVTIKPYKFNRYTDLLSGINAMLKTAGNRVSLKYLGDAGHVSVMTGPIENHTTAIMYDGTDVLKITSRIVYNGVNHLICLGKGELAARQVVHLYTDADGNVVPKQALFGRDEIAEVYDNTSAESLDDLKKGGLERLNEIKSSSYVDASADSLYGAMEIGDVITGTDPVTGASVKKPIGSKVLSIAGGEPVITYRLEG